jgi:HNH endonuclease/helix-turn-helix resolvase-like protein/NUMOD4 motif-containing protein
MLTHLCDHAILCDMEKKLILIPDVPENWRPVVRNPLYEVSNLGNVRRITYTSSYVDQHGYPTVQLWMGDSTKITVRVHRLVAEAFIDNPQHLPHVNHKNGDKLNSQVENLEWMTAYDNGAHAWRTGLNSSSKRKTSGRPYKLSEKDVEQIIALRGKKTAREIGAQFGVTRQTVMRVQLGQRGRTQHRSPGRPKGALFGRLTPIQAHCIKLFRGIWRQPSIAKRFGVSTAMIMAIHAGKRWPNA